MQFDNARAIKEEIAIPFSAKTANVTNGNVIDTSDCESLKIVLVAGVVSSGGFTPTAKESAAKTDATTLTSGTDIDASEIVGTDLNTAGTLAGAKLTASNTVTSFGIISKKQYVQIGLTADASTNIICGAIAVKGNLKNEAL